MIKMLFITLIFTLKSVVIFTNAQDTCQIICRNDQALKRRTSFQNIYWICSYSLVSSQN